MQFLNGLNEYYHQVRTKILMMDPIPSIDTVFSQEERQKFLGFNVSPSIETTTLAVKDQSSSYNRNQGSNNGKNFKGNSGKCMPLCSHCGKLGHMMEGCYKLVGYPPGYTYKQKSRPSMAN